MEFRMDQLTFTVTRPTARVTVLHLQGRVDSAGEAQVREQADRLHAEGARHLLLDLSQVDYISSAGLRAIHTVYKLFTPAEEIKAWQPDGDIYKSPYFKLLCPSPQVYGVLNLAGFLHNIPFFTNLKDALASFEE
jgi:anti-anti-sigma regulatory factor